MFCKKCGKQVKDGAVFCAYCGTKIMPKGQSKSGSGNKSLTIPIVVAAICILVVTGAIFVVLYLNNTDEKLVAEDITKEDDVEQTDTIDDFSSEEIEQDIVSDSNEADSSQQEDTLSDEIVEEASQYVLPDSDSTYLTKSDLYGLTQEDCRLARNELYARHGRKFDDEGLQEYFNSKDWYQGYIEPSDFNDSVLNDYEIANRDLIVQFEEEMGYR